MEHSFNIARTRPGITAGRRLKSFNLERAKSQSTEDGVNISVNIELHSRTIKSIRRKELPAKVTFIGEVHSISRETVSIRVRRRSFKEGIQVTFTCFSHLRDTSSVSLVV